MKKGTIQIFKKYNILFFFLLTFFSSKAQVYELDLPTVMEAGGAGNLSIERYRAEQKLAEAHYLQSKGWWLPQASLGIRSEHLWGAAMNADGGFFLGVERNNLWLGPQLEFSWNFGRDIYKLKAEELRVEASGFETIAESNRAILQIIEAYFNLKNAQLSREAYGQMAAIADTVSRQLQVQVDAGFRYESEVLSSRSNTRHLEIQRLEAEKEFQRRQEELRDLLNLDPTTALKTKEDLLVPLQIISEDELVGIPQDSVFQRRPEYEANERKIMAVQEERKQTTTGLLLPELRLGAYTSYFGGFFQRVSPMRPAEEPAPRTLYPTTAIQASLIWDLPLNRLIYRGELKRYDAVISLQENEQEQFRNKVTREVKIAKANLLGSKRQLEIAREAERLAAEALFQSIERQKLGTAAAFEVFQAQEYYLRSRLDYLNVVSNYNIAQYQLYVAVGNNL